MTEVRSLNQNNKKWTLTDYMMSFVKLGNRDYQLLEWFVKTYEMPILASVAMLNGKGFVDSKIIKGYKQGEFNEGRQRMVWMPENAELILNPTSGAPGFIIGNVYCLPGVPSILKSMLGGLENKISGGKPLISQTINLRTVESEIAKSITEIQNNNDDVEIGSYPFFKAGKLGVSIVIRSPNKEKIDVCEAEILELVKYKDIEVVEEV